MSLSACLVTSTPSYEAPERTPPFLSAQSAQPDLRQIKKIDLDLFSSNTSIEFGAAVRSEDNGAPVFGRLVLDYGVLNSGPGNPYRQDLGDWVQIPASTLDAPPRKLAAQWFPASDTPTDGCHNVTLFATHDTGFNNGGCPADPTDFDFLSWTILVCKGSLGSCCDPTALPEDGGCTQFQCPAISSDVRCDGAADTAALDSQADPSDIDPGGAP